MNEWVWLILDLLILLVGCFVILLACGIRSSFRSALRSVAVEGKLIECTVVLIDLDNSGPSASHSIQPVFEYAYGGRRYQGRPNFLKLPRIPTQAVCEKWKAQLESAPIRTIFVDPMFPEVYFLDRSTLGHRVLMTALGLGGIAIVYNCVKSIWSRFGSLF